jgi:hypothetical protein
VVSTQSTTRYRVEIFFFFFFFLSAAIANEAQLIILTIYESISSIRGYEPQNSERPQNEGRTICSS